MADVAKRSFRSFMNRCIPVLALVIAMAILLGACGRNDDFASAPELKFGVLGSTCDKNRVGALNQAGVELAQMDVRWDRLEPISGQLDRSYARDLELAIRACQDAGIKVVLGLGLQYAPEWVSKLPDGKYVDQAGNAHPGQTPNIIFSNDVRWAFGRHATNVLNIFPAESIYAIRLGTSEAGELGYPKDDQQDSTLDTRFWAFNETAQTGKYLPSGVDRAPLPGWKPGSKTWRGRDLNTSQVKKWFEWYSDSVAHAVLWQADRLRELGYVGQFHVPLAGRGALPSDLQLAIESRLDGTGNRDGSLERGLYYPEQLRILNQGVRGGEIIADVTGLDDSTAVQARLRRPATDTCSPMDHRIDLVAHPDVDHWSASRWTIANARRSGLEVMGENPGSPDAPGTGADEHSDDLIKQMRHAPRYAHECGLSAFLWAFEDDLFGEKQNRMLKNYENVISAYQ